MNSPAKTTQKSLHYYVINLPQSDERRRHMRDVLGSLFSPPPPIRVITGAASQSFYANTDIPSQTRCTPVLRHGIMRY